jgi:hypothetical protein
MSIGLLCPDLPDPLKPWCLHSKDSAAARHRGWKGLYGRVDWNSHFATTLTEMSPMGKQGVRFFFIAICFHFVDASCIHADGD